jgi:hypothetical protein
MTQILVATTGGIVEFPDRSTTLEGREINALAVEEGDRYALADSSTVLRGTDDGWQEMGEVQARRANCIMPSRHGLFVGTSEAHLVREADGQFTTVEEFESAPGREDWFTPWGGPPDVRSLAEDESGALYCNVHVGGILKSEDGGTSWLPTIEIGSDVHEVTTAANAVLAATAWGLGSSRDRGATWEFDDEGLHATYARAVAVAGDTVIMSVARGPRGGESTLYRRPLDPSGSFTRCSGLPDWFSDNINTGSLSALGATVVFGTEEGELYLSDDSGATFERIADGLPPVRWVELI